MQLAIIISLYALTALAHGDYHGLNSTSTINSVTSTSTTPYADIAAVNSDIKAADATTTYETGTLTVSSVTPVIVVRKVEDNMIVTPVSTSSAATSTATATSTTTATASSNGAATATYSNNALPANDPPAVINSNSVASKGDYQHAAISEPVVDSYTAAPAMKTATESVNEPIKTTRTYAPMKSMSRSKSGSLASNDTVAKYATTTSKAFKSYNQSAPQQTPKPSSASRAGFSVAFIVVAIAAIL